MQIRYLLAALLLGATPTLLANDVLDLDARIERGRALLVQAEEQASNVVLAQSQELANAALARLEQYRDQGASNAAYELGFAYLAGRFGIATDIDEARRNYEIAVDQELPAALADFGLMLYSGNHFPVDTERGLTLINRAAELGSLRAVAFLIDLLRTAGPEQDTIRADAWYESLDRAQDYAYGQVSIYVMLRQGVIYADDPALAASWLQRIDAQLAPVALDEIASSLSVANHLQSDQHLARALQEIAFAYPNPTPTIINNYAWLLSTARSDDLRDGAKAIQLMEALLLDVEAASFMIDTLAAAYAEVGDFKAAIATQEKANELFAAESQNLDIGLDHHAAYAEGRAWRE